MTRVADIIANFIYSTLNVDTVFLVTGGGAMFLNDGIAKHSHIKTICNHHEQASAMGAVGFAKYKNSYSVAMTTSGCGATNAITGLLDAWQDNVPVFFISGQVKRRETMYNKKLSLRQLGVQEANIIPIVESISKYSVMINNAEDILYHLEKAAYLAKHDRFGPVWLDIPQDIQGALVDESSLRHFNPTEEGYSVVKSIDKSDVERIHHELLSAKRPMVIAGNGVRLSDSIHELQVFVEKYNIPITTSFLGIDLIDNNSNHFIGRLGLKGDRAGNFAVQNSDYVLVLGARLAVAMTGFDYASFLREAKVTVVDIDTNEHKKETVSVDFFVHGDIKDFLSQINLLDANQNMRNSVWLDKCNHWKKIWPTCLSEYNVPAESVNMYSFVDCVNNLASDEVAYVADAGSAFYVAGQALQPKHFQRYITSGAQADMGFTMPAAIGVAVASQGEVIAITGDGSFQMNIQEIQTMKQNNLPIKLFVLNNNGYLSIRTTQKKFFEERYLGTDADSGISFPDLAKLATAYDIPFIRASTFEELSDVVGQVLSLDGFVLCEIICPENQLIIPTVSSIKKDDGTMVSKPIEDMFPFLSRNEFNSEMIVKPVEE